MSIDDTRKFIHDPVRSDLNSVFIIVTTMKGKNSVIFILNRFIFCRENLYELYKRVNVDEKYARKTCQS